MDRKCTVDIACLVFVIEPATFSSLTVSSCVEPGKMALLAHEHTIDSQHMHFVEVKAYRRLKVTVQPIVVSIFSRTTTQYHAIQDFLNGKKAAAVTAHV